MDDVDFARTFFLKETLESVLEKQRTLETENSTLREEEASYDNSNTDRLTEQWRESLRRSSKLRHSVRDLRREVALMRRAKRSAQQTERRNAEEAGAALREREEAYKEACAPLHRLSAVEQQSEALGAECELLRASIEQTRQEAARFPDGALILSDLILRVSLARTPNEPGASALASDALVALFALLSCPALAERSSLERVLRVMRLYPHSATIQAHGARLLWKLAARNPSITPLLVACDAVLVILRAVGLHLADEDVHQCCSGCLRAIVPAEPFRYAVTRGDGPMLSHLCDLFKQPHYPPSLGRVSKLTQSRDQLVQATLGRRGTDTHARSRREAAMEDRRAAEAAARSRLGQILTSELGYGAGQKGSHEALPLPTIDMSGVVDLWSAAAFCICRACGSDISPAAAARLYESALSAFSALREVIVRGADSLRETMAHRHILRITCILLRSGKSHARLQLAGCSLLGLLLVNCDIGRRELISDGVLSVFESARRNHPDDMEVQRLTQMILADF